MSNRAADYLQIAISGRSGCGNTTVCGIISDRLGLKMINYTFKSVAAEDGITPEEVGRLAEGNDDYDLRVDRTQVELARKQPSVLGSRLAVWMLKEARLKVFLTGSPEVRAQRIFEREGGALEEIMKKTHSRDALDHARYKRLYDIDNNDYAFVDLIVNTDRLNAQQVADIIETAARSVAVNL